MRLKLNIVYNCDCMDFMKKQQDFFKVDGKKYANVIAIVDPPYGIGWDRERESMSAGTRIDGSSRKNPRWKNQKAKKYKKGNYDKTPPPKEYFDILRKISRYQIIWGGNYFINKLPPTGGWFVFDKKQSMPSLSKGELAWTNIINHLEIFRYLWSGFCKEKPEDRIHVNQKPVALYMCGY